MNSVADIPINRLLGVSYDASTGVMTLPESESVRNYFGQVSFCAQLSLAEAASAQYMFDRLGMNLEYDMPTLRKVVSKILKPTNGESICQLGMLEHDENEFQEILRTKGRILTWITVDVVSCDGIKALSADFRWLVIRP